MEPLPGTYALILESRVEGEIAVGRLGRLHLAPGWYVYVGSAFGPGGLRARCAHHRRPAPNPHWHIDYLRAFTRVHEVWYTVDSRPREHQWAEHMRGARGARVPLPGFGSTDCHCPSHLSLHPGCPSLEAFRRRLTRLAPGHSPVCRHTPA